MKSSRLDQIEQYVLDHGSATLAELGRVFDVSIHTIRRDTALLIKKGAVQKVYGGVRASTSDTLSSFEERTIRNQSGKIAIGRSAAELVRDDEIIFIDSGTTTLQLIPHLAGKKNVTVVTHSLPALNAALGLENLNVIVLPGQLQRKTNSFTGLEALHFLQSYNITTSFMATTAVSIANGVTNSSPLEYELKRVAMQRSTRKVLMASGEKFGKSALLTYAEIGAFNTIVTDVQVDEAHAEAIRRAGVELIVELS